MPSFSKTSQKRLSTCVPILQDLLNEVIKHYDCTIITGHRTKEEQNKKVAEKTSRTPWPKSKHNTYPSLAVDVAPWPIPDKWGDNDWKERAKFYELKAVMFYQAKLLNIKLRWGGDWDGDGDYRDQTFDDLIHFEVKQ